MRDLVLFQTKLFLDSLKDIFLLQASVGAALIDILFMGRTRGRCFYTVLRVSERIDLWLNLHGAAQRASLDHDGLFGVSRAGDPTFLGQMEELVRESDKEHQSPISPARRQRVA